MSGSPLWRDLTKVIFILNYRGPENIWARNQSGSPRWEVSTLEKSNLNSLLIAIWNIYIWARDHRECSTQDMTWYDSFHFSGCMFCPNRFQTRYISYYVCAPVKVIDGKILPRGFSKQFCLVCRRLYIFAYVDCGNNRIPHQAPSLPHT